MRLLDVLRLRLKSLFRRRRVEQELDDELRFHLVQLIEQNLAQGMPAEQARAEALRRFGGVAQIEEQCRDTRGTGWLEEFVKDCRYALRLFRRSPGFTAVAVISLALGIGANTAIFSLLEALVLRPLPVFEPEALVQIVGLTRDGRRQGSQSYPTYEWLRRNAPMFSHVFVWSSSRLEIGEGDAMEWLTIHQVSENYFAGLGVRPALGRFLGDEHEQPTVVVLSYRWWRDRLASEPAVAGRLLRIGGVPFTIVGVAPETFFGPDVGKPPDLYIPLTAQTALKPERDLLRMRNASWLTLMARLKSGVSLEQASAQFEALWPECRRETGPLTKQGELSSWFQELNGGLLPAGNGVSELRRHFQTPLWILLAGVAIILLIACVNLANLLLARAASRQREMAIRLAAGARRSRLIRQLLTESLLLSVLGAFAGALLAMWSSHALVRALSSVADRFSLPTELNGTVLAFTALVTVATAFLFGAVPAVRSVYAIQPVLKENTHQIAGSQAWSRSLLVVQVALSLVLLVGAALLLQTFRNLLTIETGFDTSRVLTVFVDAKKAGFEGAAAARFYGDLQQRLDALPGVESVSMSWMTPILGCCWWERASVEGHTPRTGENAESFLDRVTPGYFRTMGLMFLHGRDFEERDARSAQPVAIVNRTMARRFFTQGDAVGRYIRISDGPKLQIIGIVEDSKVDELRRESVNMTYLPLVSQKGEYPLDTNYPASLHLQLRTAGPPALLARAVQREIHAFHRTMPVKVHTLADEVESTLTRERLLAMLGTFFGALALVLASVGLYGTVSYAVARRTSEIAIRMALGASRAGVLWMMLAQNLVLVVAGLLVGTLTALATAKYLETLLFGIDPTDTVTFAAASTLLAAVTLIAALIPARRATDVDPAQTLRYE